MVKARVLVSRGISGVIRGDLLESLYEILIMNPLARAICE